MLSFVRLWPLLFLLIVGCNSDFSTITIVTSTTNIPITVEIADSLDEQAVGLMYRSELDNYHGMLFVFDDTKIRNFWMKNTKIALDILFIDENKNIIDIKENVAPCYDDPCPVYTSTDNAMYTLEVNAGFVKEHEIIAGNKVVW